MVQTCRRLAIVIARSRSTLTFAAGAVGAIRTGLQIEGAAIWTRGSGRTAILRASSGYPRTEMRPRKEADGLALEALRGESAVHKEDRAAIPLHADGRLLGVLEARGVSRRTFGSLKDVCEILSEGLERAEGHLFHARVDPVSGLHHRKEMIAFLEERLGEGTAAVVLVRIPFLEDSTQDEGAHQAIREAADELRCNVRCTDMVARLGPGLFGIVLPGLNRSSAAQIADRVSKVLQDQDIAASTQIQCETSDGTDGQKAETLVAAAIRRLDGEQSPPVSLVDRVAALLCPDHREAGLSLLQDNRAVIPTLMAESGCDPTERELLDACLLSAPGFLAEAGGREGSLSAALNGDLATLREHLECLAERWDGQGPTGRTGDQIPSIGRIVSILVAAQMERGSALTDDPMRFDPRLLDRLMALRPAA